VSYRMTPCARLMLVALFAIGFAAPCDAQSNTGLPITLPIPCEAVDEVGAATMSGDGIITLQLRKLSADSVPARQLHYAPGDPRYDEVKRHLGGIAPGQTKPLPPLCGTNSEP
jgi:hypothetical protein